MSHKAMKIYHGKEEDTKTYWLDRPQSHLENHMRIIIVPQLVTHLYKVSEKFVTN